MDFKGKKVTVMGLGLYEEGSGISAVRFLVSVGAKVLVTDLKTATQLQSQIKRLGSLAQKIKFILGHHREEDFINADLIVKNPGVPSTSKFLQIARDYQVPIETDISIFFQLISRKRVVGITGTRGKSTTASLIYEIFKTENSQAVLGGNITRSPLAQMSLVKKGGPVILELSSWMLESMEPKKLSPYVALVTNIYPDHLNTYKSIKEYAVAKENIFLWQNLQDKVVLNRDNDFTKKMGRVAPGRRFWFSLKPFQEENGCFVRHGHIYFRLDGREEKVMPVKEIKVPGEHNLANVLSAICVAMAYGIKTVNIRKTVKNFRGIPNRLEFLRTIGGVKYYNDTTSTTPEATMVALAALSKKQEKKKTKKQNRIILIAGGSDKGLDFKELIREIKKHCKAVVLLNGTGTVRLKKLLVTSYWLPVTIVNSMIEAVSVAQSFAKRGDIILLSPACASFGMFINEFDRGNQFRKIINTLK